MANSIQDQVKARIEKSRPDMVWSASDFADIAGREAVDKALQRLTAEEVLQKVAWGLYKKFSINRITNRPNPPNYAQVLDALMRRDATPMLIDGMTAANDLGLTTAVPAKIVVHTNSRRKELDLGGQKIEFRQTAPSKLTWAGRPAMRLIQALQWLRDSNAPFNEETKERVADILTDGERGERIRNDLVEGFKLLPTSWLQEFLRPMLFSGESTKDRIH
jgi:hypothetical protein